MLSFCKLPVNIVVPDDYLDGSEVHHRYEKVQRYARDYEQAGFGMIPSETHSLREDVVDFCVQQLPKELLQVEVPMVFALRVCAPDVHKPMLPPHVDYKRTCAINVYMAAQGGKTNFYTWDPIKRCCDPSGSFVAQKGEVWLLDTSKPHSVDLEPGSERIAVTFSFTQASYADVAGYFHNAS